MAVYIGRKLFHLVPVLLAVTALAFLMAQLLPGDVAVAMLGDQATPDKVEALRQELGLNQPLWVQYLHWLGGVLSGDFGVSRRTTEPVLHAILNRLPMSVELMVLAEAGAILVGIPLGILCAAKRDSSLDRGISALAFAMLAFPPYMLAIVLIFGFSLRLGILPSTGFVPFGQNLPGNLRSLVLPALTLAAVEWPVLTRVLRSDLITTLQQDFIATARAKGLPAHRVLLVHALKPSSFTVVTVAGVNMGRLIGGALIVEVIFALPGIGRLLVEGIYSRDFIVVQGTVVFVAVGFVLVNLLVDLTYTFLDPRIRHGNA